jgi:exodeoxyribonuclease VIII
MHNIMLDLETLDTTSTAVVLSIGAVAFDPYGSVLGDKFYVELTEDLADQQTRGRTISASTVKWWLGQSVMARQVFTDPPQQGVDRRTTAQGLHKFATFVASNGGAGAFIWGNGADFDNVILASLYNAYKIPQPWHFGSNRCYRTLKSLHLPRLNRQGTHHNALDDAVSQASHVQDIFRWLAPR